MLYVFKSAACADVIMFGDIAKQLVQILGKDPEDARGIVTAEQLPEAIARLRAAVEADRLRQREQRPADDDDDDEPDPERSGMAAPVSLAQRAWPLLDMLERSHKEAVPVVWGV